MCIISAEKIENHCARCYEPCQWPESLLITLRDQLTKLGGNSVRIRTLLLLRRLLLHFRPRLLLFSIDRCCWPRRAFFQPHTFQQPQTWLAFLVHSKPQSAIDLNYSAQNKEDEPRRRSELEDLSKRRRSESGKASFYFYPKKIFFLRAFEDIHIHKSFSLMK